MGRRTARKVPGQRIGLFALSLKRETSRKLTPTRAGSPSGGVTTHFPIRVKFRVDPKACPAGNPSEIALPRVHVLPPTNHWNLAPMSSSGKSSGNRKHILVVGGSVAGLGAACVLTQEGHRVTILEKDATPLPASPLEAFERWERPGAPQTRHSHAFLARLHGILRRRAPRLLEDLLEHGAYELRFVDLARQTLERDDLDFRAEDHEIKLLACRRVTFEWALRKHVLETGRAEFRGGTEVTGLDAETAPGAPRRYAECTCDMRTVHARGFPRTSCSTPPDDARDSGTGSKRSAPDCSKQTPSRVESSTARASTACSREPRDRTWEAWWPRTSDT